jgi:heptosyltransferase-3
MTKDSQSPSVVIYRLGSLGDTIVALPCFHAIKAAFPDHQRIVLTNFPVSQKAAPLQDILQNGGLIHGAIAYPVGTRRLSDLLGVRRALRRTGADTLIYLGGGGGLKRTFRDKVFFGLCGIRRIIGAPAKVEDDYGRVTASGEREPEAERLARCLEALGPIELDDRRNWDLELTPGEHDAAEHALAGLEAGRFIAVNTGGKAAQKDWGEGNWTRLLQLLRLEAGDRGLVFVGAAEDDARAQQLGLAWGGPFLSVCGALNPRQSAAVLARADVCIGHDSGPLHLAACMQTPTVGLFGDFNTARKWHPYGAANRVIHDMRGMAAIAPARVMEAVRLALQGRTGDN